MCRILVDGGSLVNIIKLETLKRMNIPESKIITRSSILVGFKGEVKSTMGEINSIQKFCVMDSLTSSNIVLGRPWIHHMKALRSTYAQCVKMSTS